MSQEQKAAQEAEEAVKATDEQPAEGESPDKKLANEPDEDSKQLKADLKREREAREKAEKATADLAFKYRDKKRQPEEPIEDEASDDKPLTAKELQVILAKEREESRKEFHKSEADRVATNLSTSDMEKELLLEIYKNRSFPSHLSLEEKFEECFVIANKKKLLGENSELKRALRGKQGVSKDASTTHQDPPTGNAPKLAQGEAAEMARVGFKFNTTAKRFEKKLNNGQVLVKDKSGQTYIVKA